MLIALPARAQGGDVRCPHADGSERLFAAASYETRFEQAKRLNAQAHYLEAYGMLKSLHKDLLDAFDAAGITAAELPDRQDFLYYLNVLSSEAECAYKANLGAEILALHNEQVNAFNARIKTDYERVEEYYWPLGATYKNLGDYYYLLGIKNAYYYYEAESAYESAIEYFGLADDAEARAIVYAELAQVAYAQRLYTHALASIDDAISAISQRRATGSNARESFTTPRREALTIEFNAAKAMCEAQDYEYRTALNTIEGVIDRLPKGSKRLPELNRRRAKILMLQHQIEDTPIGDASKLYEDYFRAIKDSVSAHFMQMTADQREEYWMQERPFIVDCYQLEDRNPELLYDVTLYNKGMLLQTARSFDNLLHDGSKKGQTDERTRLAALRQEDAKNALDGRLTTLAADYERQLLQTMTTDGRRKKFFQPLNHTWRDVQKALPADGCAIEFVEYEKLEAMHFGALVLHKTGRPQFVYVCNADDLADFELEDGVFTLSELLSTTNSYSKNYIYNAPTLGEQIWTPALKDAIGSSRKVYFSPDGFLHQLAIEYLLPNGLDDKNFYRLSSTRVLVDGSRINADSIRNGAAFVLGGISYETLFSEDTSADAGNDAMAYRTMQEMGAYFKYLKGSKEECDSIIHYRNNPRDLYLSDLQATEHAFYEHCGEYPLLHISTHGSFVGDATVRNGLLSSSTKDVLSQSTLALSYATANLQNSQFDVFYKDGLLSAREVARLDLSNVQLVTLSACQTALGYITADGIYGLQRGFKSAGAHGLVTTLWSVFDVSACIFFTNFYRYMAEGETVHKAFHHARNDLLTKEYTTIEKFPIFNGATLSRKPVTRIVNQSYAEPVHSCPYILIDAWD